MSSPVTLQVESIFLPTDFSEASQTAFYHALKISQIARTELNVLHVTESDEPVDWTTFPRVRETLERWKVLPANSSRSNLNKLGIGVTKACVRAGNVVKAAVAFLDEHPADLIVIATRHDAGKVHWFGGSVAEPIARKTGQMTLFLPNNCPGFVSRETGEVNLKTILIPVAEKPTAQPSVQSAWRTIQSLKLPPGQVELFHVGKEKLPLDLPAETNWTWEYILGDGAPVTAILKRAAAIKADLIIMTTDGPDGFLDGLRGTTSERVLAQANCPVLIIPSTVIYQ